MSGAYKTANSRLEDQEAAYDAYSAPAAVKRPGHGKEAEHVNRHDADKSGSHIKHVGHTTPRLRGRRHTPEPEKKGGMGSWGTQDPEEVLVDQQGAGKTEALADFMAPESNAEKEAALWEATTVEPADANSLTLEEYEKKIGHEI